MERHIRYIDGVEIAESNEEPEEHPAIAWRRARSRAAFRRPAARVSAIAMAWGLASGAALWFGPKSAEIWLMAGAHIGAALIAFVAAPLVLGRLAGNLIDEALGAGAEGDPVADLAALPDYPRPVRFHALRATLEPYRFSRSFLPSLCVAAPLTLPWIALATWNNQHGKWLHVTNFYEYVTRPVSLVDGVAYWLILTAGATLATAFLIRQAASWRLGWRGGLGALAPLALQVSFGPEDSARIAGGDALDEASRVDRVSNAAGFAGESARRFLSDLAFAAVFCAATWLGALLALYAVLLARTGGLDWARLAQAIGAEGADLRILFIFLATASAAVAGGKIGARLRARIRGTSGA